MKKRLFFIFYLIFFALQIFAIENPVSSPSLFSSIPKNHLISKIFNVQNVENLYITSSYEQVYFLDVYGDEISVDIYSNNNVLLPKIKLDNKTKTLNVESIIPQDKNKIATKGDICTILIYIPKDYKFKNFNYSSFDSFDKVNDKTNLEIPKIKAETIYIQTQSSNILNTENQKISSNLILKTDKGNIDIDNIIGKELSVTTKNGEINVNNFNGDYLLLKSPNNITANNIIANFFEIKSKTGNISVSLKKAISNSSYIETTSGLVQLFLTKNSSFNLSLYSPRGYLVMKPGNRKASLRHEYTKTYNKGGAKLKVCTTTGNIEIEES